jgi:hypothetical protein
MADMTHEEQEKELSKNMKLVRECLENVPHWELEKIIMYHYFVSPKSIKEMTDVWQETNNKIGGLIKKYL